MLHVAALSPHVRRSTKQREPGSPRTSAHSTCGCEAPRSGAVQRRSDDESGR
jgi:hypothetical protein